MPNWCSNTLTIKGSKKDAIKFFEKAGFDPTSELGEFIKNNKLTLRSWMPMPKTFVEMDTTNQKRKREYFANDEEYETYSKAYDDAAKHQKETYGVVGWYAYNLKTLGCKWDEPINEYGSDYIESNDSVEITFEFDTPWSPPTTWLETIIKDNNGLTFQLDGYEPGCWFHTHMFGEDGEVVENFDEVPENKSSKDFLASFTTSNDEVSN